MEYVWLYLFTQISSIGCLFMIVGFIGTTVCIVGSLFTFFSSLDEQYKIKRYTDQNNWRHELKAAEESYTLLTAIHKTFRRYIKYAVFCLLFATFLPSQKQLAFIAVAPMVYNNQDVQETVKTLPKAIRNSAESMELLTRLAGEYLKDQLPTTNKESK